MAKTVDLELLDSPKLISRKMWIHLFCAQFIYQSTESISTDLDLFLRLLRSLSPSEEELDEFEESDRRLLELAWINFFNFSLVLLVSSWSESESSEGDDSEELLEELLASGSFLISWVLTIFEAFSSEEEYLSFLIFLEDSFLFSSYAIDGECFVLLEDDLSESWFL